MSVTSVEEYRKRIYKIVELPSGAKFKIRKMSPSLVNEVLSILGIKLSPSLSPEEARKEFEQKMSDKDFPKFLAEVAPLVVSNCVVEPKISLNPSEDALSFDELEPMDVFNLLTQILDFTGLTAEAAERRSSFR